MDPFEHALLAESTTTRVANLSGWITHSEAVATAMANSVTELADEGDLVQNGFLSQECENIISDDTKV